MGPGCRPGGIVTTVDIWHGRMLLGVAQRDLLTRMEEQGPASLQALVDLTDVEPSTLTRRLAALGRQGFIRRDFAGVYRITDATAMLLAALDLVERDSRHRWYETRRREVLPWVTR